MQDVSDHFRGSGFAIFARILEGEGTEVRAIPAPGGGSRKFCDRMNAWAQAAGAAGDGVYFLAGSGKSERVFISETSEAYTQLSGLLTERLEHGMQAIIEGSEYRKC